VETTRTVYGQSCVTTGLVLGKFAPFHKGHQLLVDTARKLCDRLYVLIYDSRDVTDIPLYIRANWIRTLYPDVIVIEGWGAPSESGHDPDVMQLQEDYIRRVIPEPITYFFSSEWYGEHVSRALGATNVVVDEDRDEVPISGTRVRKNPHETKDFLDPYVYKDHVERVVLLGAESTGKSTLAKALAEHFLTAHVPEHGRDFWALHHDEGGRLTSEQLIELICEHEANEDEASLSAEQYLFVDTNAITTCYYDLFYHGSIHPELLKHARLATDRYQHWFVLDTDIPFEQDGTREDMAHREAMQKAILEHLKVLGVHYTLLTGSVEERIGQVKTALKMG